MNINARHAAFELGSMHTCKACGVSRLYAVLLAYVLECGKRVGKRACMRVWVYLCVCVCARARCTGVCSGVQACFRVRRVAHCSGTQCQQGRQETQAAATPGATATQAKTSNTDTHIQRHSGTWYSSHVTIMRPIITICGCSHLVIQIAQSTAFGEYRRVRVCVRVCVCVCVCPPAATDLAVGATRQAVTVSTVGFAAG